jgi:hypothetical protein
MVSIAQKVTESGKQKFHRLVEISVQTFIPNQLWWDILNFARNFFERN